MCLHHPMDLNEIRRDTGDSELSTSIHLSQLPYYRGNVSSCLKPLLLCLPAVMNREPGKPKIFLLSHSLSGIQSWQ